MCFASELNVFGEDLNSIISCDTGVTDVPGRIPVVALAKTLIRAQVKSSMPSESSSSRSHHRQSQHSTWHMFWYV